MTQSHQAKCACHSHREEHHRHHGHHKKPQAPKGPPDDKVKDKPGEKLVVVKKPDEKPWSQWIAGDDARWFYRGRLKQGGRKTNTKATQNQSKLSGSRRVGVSIHGWLHV